MHVHSSKTETLHSYLESVHLALQRRRGSKVALLSLGVLCAILVAGLWLLYRSDFQTGFLVGLRAVLVLALQIGRAHV